MQRRNLKQIHLDFKTLVKQKKFSKRKIFSHLRGNFVNTLPKSLKKRKFLSHQGWHRYR